jgi:hypothetical protein
MLMSCPFSHLFLQENVLLALHPVQMANTCKTVPEHRQAHVHCALMCVLSASIHQIVRKHRRELVTGVRWPVNSVRFFRAALERIQEPVLPATSQPSVMLGSTYKAVRESRQERAQHALQPVLQDSTSKAAQEHRPARASCAPWCVQLVNTCSAVVARCQARVRTAQARAHLGSIFWAAERHHLEYVLCAHRCVHLVNML